MLKGLSTLRKQKVNLFFFCHRTIPEYHFIRNFVLDCQNVFALICRSHYETKERLYSFEITSEDVDKVAFLKTLCRLMANITCRADAVHAFNI
jgi:hypothetical protein